MRHTIGGEFESDPLFNSSVYDRTIEPEDGFWYASGRSALYHIITHAKEHYSTTRVLLPEWLCSSMVDAAQMAGAKIAFYELDHHFLPDLNCLNVEGGDLIIAINYFGLQNIEPTIEQLKTTYPSLPVVLDLVQAYFEMKQPSKADYRFTSLRKTFAIVDGGWVLSHHNDLERPAIQNRFSELKFNGAYLKFESLNNSCIDDAQFLDLFNRGEDMINHCDQIKSTISDQSLRLYQVQNFEQIACRRRQNARYVTDELMQIGIKPLIETANTGCVPLFVPIKIENRDIVRKSMQSQGIFCPVHWPQVGGAGLSAEMQNNELSIVVDQRYGADDMKRVIEVIKKWR